MVKKNDNTILELKKQIEDKKKALKGVERFSPATNCSLELDGVRTNLNVADSVLLTLLLVKLNSFKLSADSLGLSDFTISGFKLDEWLSDVRSKLLIINRQKEEARLKILEAKLTDLLSVEKKTELAIAELKDAL